MKFIHLGDLHLGKTVNEFRMIDDQACILEQILQCVKDRDVDAVLIAGDVYDKSIPSEEAVRLLDSFLAKLAEMGKTVIMISGNHDSDDRLQFGSRLFAARNVFITGRYEGEVPEVVLEDAFGKVHFWMLPFVKASLVAHYHPDEKVDSYDTAIRLALADANLDRSERNVILSHQFVTGASPRGAAPDSAQAGPDHADAGGDSAQAASGHADSNGDPVMAGSELVRPEMVGTIEKVGSDVYDLFDYAALGHIHSPQKVGRPQVRYSGSPLSYSLSEIGHEKTFPLVTMGPKSQVDIELIPLVPKRRMRHLKGPLAQLLDPARITDQEDYIYVTLTDEQPIPDAIGRVRTYYPNVMKLDYDNSHTKALQQVTFTGITAGRSYRELIRDFYNLMNGGEPSEEEMQILDEAAGKAGVIEV
ncbi:MAG: exonuclease SbcCD subunit D [Lachnospiraceae bacterium]|nr:exonuclease SbcCD subunit D [Lachnospiraceae bacterium]